MRQVTSGRGAKSPAEWTQEERNSIRVRVLRQLRSEPLQDERVTRALIESLAALNVDVADTLLDAIREGDEPLALSLVKTIRYHPLTGSAYDKLATGLRFLLKNNEPDIRLRAIEVTGLLRIHAPATLSELREKLIDGDPRVRYRAAVALDRIDDRSEPTVRSLADASGDHSFLVAERAAKALARFGPSASHALPKLEELAARAEPRMKEELDQTIANIRNTSVKPPASIKPSVFQGDPALISMVGEIDRDAEDMAIRFEPPPRPVEKLKRADEQLAAHEQQQQGKHAMGADIREKPLADEPDARGALSMSAGVPPSPPPVSAPIEAAADIPPPAPEAKVAIAPLPKVESRASKVEAHAVMESDLPTEKPSVPRKTQDTASETAGTIAPSRGEAVETHSLSDSENASVMLAALHDDNPDIRAEAAMRSAEQQLSGSEIREALRKALDDPTQKVRFAAGYALGAMGEEGLKILAEESRNENPLVRMSAVQAIKAVRPASSEVYGLLEERLTYDAEPIVRLKAAAALIGLDQKHRAAIGMLIERLAAQTDQIRTAALEGLRRADRPTVTESTLQLLQSGGELEKIGALSAVQLLKLEDPRLATAVTMLGNDPRIEVQSAAARLNIDSAHTDEHERERGSAGMLAPDSQD